MPGDRLSPKDRRLVLEQLSRDRLSDLTTGFELEVSDRRSTDAHIDAIVRKRSVDFRRVLETLSRDELKAACKALKLDTTGKEKATLIARILGEGGEDAATGKTATLPGLDLEPTSAATPSSKRTPKRRAAPEPEPPARTSPSSVPPATTGNDGALKSSLRRFVLDIAGGVRGRDAATSFTARLLQCFGWPEAGPPKALMPASLSVVENGQRTTRDVALFWKERRVLVEVVKHDVMLDFAWKELLRVCLQIDPVPHYVVLTNQRDLHLYDLGRDRDTPRLPISLDDLPKYSEAFPFLSPTWTPGMTPTIINVSKVSTEVADLVAKLYRSLKQQHPSREKDVVQFTLQCILAMFAEDIGLLPQEYFTTLLYEGARTGDTEKRLAELFRLMSTRDVKGARAVPYFNGGLFTDPVSLPLGAAQLAALTKASEANWKYVDPHIFGSVFQGIMNDAERHKSGAHYTAHDDIMRVVGPTIVEPWRKRIQEAKTLGELVDVRAELMKFRVLDPACGSGNFLYVAFKELYKLDTELLRRLNQFSSTQAGSAKITWGAGIQASNFYGIDINPFAVELAKVTLNIAKKIAFDERREFAADVLGGQLELDVDPSLPLDNLEINIVCADALFTDWPEADAIVGNPPFLGGTMIRRELGETYLARLGAAFPGVNGGSDICAYWFRRAHDRLKSGGRAGLVGTSGIRVGKARDASLDYVVSQGGRITNAVSSRAWPGDAAVDVSMVNWTKGPSDGRTCQLVIDGTVFEVAKIASHLQLHAEVAATASLAVNRGGTSEGVKFDHEAFRASSLTSFPFKVTGSEPFLRPVATGDDLMRGRLSLAPEGCILFERLSSEADAEQNGNAAFNHLKRYVFPTVNERAQKETSPGIYTSWLRRWWKPWAPREEFFAALVGASRMLICPKVSARPSYALVSTRFVPNNTLQVFAFGDDYTFAILQSSLHWAWTKAKGGRVRADIRYTTDVWNTFPWPQEPSPAEVVAVAETARKLRRVRDTLMKENGWSLRVLYQASEIAGAHPLKDAQGALDDAVRAAYGMPDDQEATEFLLELNQLVAADEAEGRKVQGPGIPACMDPQDPRLMSDDCIQPPSV